MKDDDRMAVIDHMKSDSRFGVRPITKDGNYYINTSAHWPMKDRQRIPEERSCSVGEMIAMTYEEIPPQFRRPKE